MVMTAAEARTHGDATDEQRATLTRLLETKRYSKGWRDQLFHDIRDDGGLSSARASSVAVWLEAQLDLADGASARADADTIARIEELLRQRIAPGRWARQILDRIADNTLSYDQADLYLRDLERLPKRAFVAPAGLGPGTPGTDAPDGYFALTDPAGQTYAYRIHHLYGGDRAVDRFTSDLPGPRRSIRGLPAIQVMRVVGADPAGAARLFAATRGRCSNCNQPLHNEDQPGFAHGYGLDCWTNRQTAPAAPAGPPAGETR